MSFLRHYLIALHFFTRVPVNGALAQWAGFRPDMPATAIHFPGVGWLVGLVACTVFALLGLALPDSPFAPLAAAVACLAATVMLTGGAHEAGLVHVADALGASGPRERALEIMKQPHLGSHGALALFVVLVGKVSLLAVLAEQSPACALAALLAAHVLSRFWPLLLVRSLPYVGDAGAPRNKLVAERIDSTGIGVAAAWCVVPLVIAWLAQDAAFVIMGVLISGLAFWWMRWTFARRLQGFTGEGVGATQQVCEVAFYLGAAIGFSVS